MTYQLVMTRHYMRHLPEYAKFSDPNPGTNQPHVPLGAELEPPFPEAKFFFVDHNVDGWAYVYWIDYRLLNPVGSTPDAEEI